MHRIQTVANESREVLQHGSVLLIPGKATPYLTTEVLGLEQEFQQLCGLLSMLFPQHQHELGLCEPQKSFTVWYKVQHVLLYITAEFLSLCFC